MIKIEVDYFDKDDYPTDEVLELIKNWKFDNENVYQFISLIENLWKYDGFSITMEKGEEDKPCKYKYLNLHTYGWSGNEDIIESLRGNALFWSMFWYTSKRGGHYKFDLSGFYSTFDPEYKDESV